MAVSAPLNFRPSRREAIYLGALGLILLGIQLVTLPANPNGPDATTYVAIAQEQIGNAGFWSNPMSLVGNFWAIGYPTVLALAFRLTGGSLQAVSVGQSVLMASLVVVPWILSRGLPKAVQWGAPAVLVATPAAWWMGHTIGYEAMLAWLVGFAIALTWMLYHRGLGSRPWVAVAVSAGIGLLLAAALLTQTKVLVVIPVVAVLLLKVGRRPAVSAAAAFIVGLLPWMVRNALVLGNPNPLSGNGGYNLWVGNNPDATTGGSMLVAPPTPNGESMTAAAVNFILSQPERWIELTLSKAARLLQPSFVYLDQVPVGPARTALHLYAAALSLIVTIGVLVFLGAWAMRGSRSVPPVAPLALMVLLWFASHLPFIAESRYMTTMLPLSATVAAAAWWSIVTRLTGRGRGGSSGEATSLHAQVQELERQGMAIPLDLSIPSWRADQIVTDVRCIEPSSTVTIPAQECGLPEEHHSWPDLNVRTLTNVKLDVDSSLVFADGRVIAQSGTGTRASRDAAFVSGATFRVREAEPIRFAGAVAPLGDVHHHYHVMLETLPRILHAQAYRPDVTFVTSAPIPERYERVLDDWGVRVHHVTEGTVLSPEEVILVDQPELFWPRRADLSVLRAAFDSLRIPAETAQRIFVSRRRSGRQLAHDEDLEGALERSGFSVVDMGDLDLVSQTSTFSSAMLVAGIHGAGLAGILFMDRDRQVVELSSGELFEGCYRRIAALTQLDYRLVLLEGRATSPHGVASEALATITGLTLKNHP